MQTVRSIRPSYIALPQQNDKHRTVLAFLIDHFSQIEKSIWHARVRDGKVHWANGELIDESTPYVAMAKVYYYREVAHEPKIPFSERILFHDENIIIAYKPHFLVVSPGGEFVNECLTHRLCNRFKIDTIAPAHRLDRDTAGVILLTKKREVRHAYHELFKLGEINKQYHAIARLTEDLLTSIQSGVQTLPIHWSVKNQLKRSNPSFLQEVGDSDANSHSEITLVATHGEYGLFELSPITGKTHQLRVHMMSLGMPILNDRFYPQLAPKGPDNFERPLALVARRLSFIDPMTQKFHDVSCEDLAGFDLIK